jgi:hypothetical protein
MTELSHIPDNSDAERNLVISWSPQSVLSCILQKVLRICCGTAQNCVLRTVVLQCTVSFRRPLVLVCTVIWDSVKFLLCFSSVPHRALLVIKLKAYKSQNVSLTWGFCYTDRPTSASVSFLCCPVPLLCSASYITTLNAHVYSNPNYTLICFTNTFFAKCDAPVTVFIFAVFERLTAALLKIQVVRVGFVWRLAVNGLSMSGRATWHVTTVRSSRLLYIHDASGSRNKLGTAWCNARRILLRHEVRDESSDRNSVSCQSLATLRRYGTR